MPAPSTPIIGRFAPSPSGPLHQGSLVAAIGSYLSAKAQGGQWLLRMEDIDHHRCRPAAVGQIQRQLAALALEWDGEILFQSQRRERYREVLNELRDRGLAYACGCTRQSLLATAGQCPCLHHPPAQARSFRLAIPKDCLTDWQDRYQGVQKPTYPHLAPVLQRADGPYAYLLANVVDDADQGISEVIRGADLLDLTPIQQFLQGQLHYPRPHYGHLPVVLGPDGKKLSKSRGDHDQSNPSWAWERTLALLGWEIPRELVGSPPMLWRDWALQRCLQGQKMLARSFGSPPHEPIPYPDCKQSQELHP